MSETIIPFYSEFFPSYFYILKRDSIHRPLNYAEFTELKTDAFTVQATYGWINAVKCKRTIRPKIIKKESN